MGMTDKQEQESRAAFEAWLMKELDAINFDSGLKDWYFSRREDGNYVQQSPRERWESWQASRAAMGAEAAELPEPDAEVNDHYSRDGVNDEISTFLPVDTPLYTADTVRALLKKGG